MGTVSEPKMFASFNTESPSEPPVGSRARFQFFLDQLAAEYAALRMENSRLAKRKPCFRPEPHPFHDETLVDPSEELQVSIEESPVDPPHAARYSKHHCKDSSGHPTGQVAEETYVSLGGNASDTSRQINSGSPQETYDRQTSRDIVVELPIALKRQFSSSVVDAGSNKFILQQKNASKALHGTPKLDEQWGSLYIASRGRSDDVVKTTSSAKPRYSTSSALLSLLDPSVSEWGCLVMQLSRLSVIDPHSKKRVLWDFMGLVLMSWDVVTIPLTLALELTPARQGPLFIISLMTLSYWSLDIPLAFLTGFYREGSLVQDKSEIAFYYLRTWFLFDIFLVSLDYYLMLSSEDAGMRALRSARVFRMLRLLRGLRLLKVSRLTMAIEDVLTFKGQEWHMMLINIVKTLVVIVMVAHLMTCAIFFVGNANRQAGEGSLLDRIDELGSHQERYAVCYLWVLGLLTAAPVDGSIWPVSQYERVFCILTLFTSLLMLSSIVAQMTSTISEIAKVNSEISETRRRLRRYLKEHGIGVELSSRIIRFAMHSMKKSTRRQTESNVLDLLSEQLRAELVVSQRSQALSIYPLFAFLFERQDTVESFNRLCNAVLLQVYGERENVFIQGAIAECLYITSAGCFEVSGIGTSLMPEGSAIVDYPYWFSEISLFMPSTSHRSSLLSLDFSEAFTVAGSSLSQCVRDSAQSIKTVYKYALAFLEELWDEAHDVPDGKWIVNDFLPRELSSNACLAVQPKATTGQLSMDKANEPSQDEKLQSFARKMLKSEITDDEIISRLSHVFVEIHEKTSIYSIASHPDERKRSMCAMFSAMLLCRNEYQKYTHLQPESRRMSPELWGELQRIVQWADMSEDMFVAMLVFLAIRGLGKIQAIATCDARTPEQAVLYILQNRRELMPSLAQLPPEHIQVLESVLEVLSRFNLGQMLQGENAPHHLKVFKDCVGLEGQQVLRFYLFMFVCVMSSLRGAEAVEGSLYMDESNARKIVWGLQCLQSLTSASPHAIYWSYIQRRAESFDLPTESAEHLVIARLVLLTRAASSGDAAQIQTTWGSLNRLDQIILMEHFLADGISEIAFLLVFLPQYFDNAKKNPVVGLRRALVALVDLIEMVRAEMCSGEADDMVIKLDLSDLAAFTKEVRNSRNFEKRVARSRVLHKGNEMQVQLHTAEYNVLDEKVDSMSHELRHVARMFSTTMGTAVESRSKAFQH